VPNLYFLRRVAHGSSSITEQCLFLCRTHQLEKLARLCVIIVIVLAEVPMVRRAVECEKWLLLYGLFLPFAVAIRLIA
jgi:hypothetical protein